ncbi:MAG: hypothetical protein K0U16_01225 [Gammaproteobacteria bacterium]|nr:hypothetical protein [Gammaproteobacteria bacterium]
MGIDVFEDAFVFFLKTGRFEFFHSKLSIKQLRKLSDHIYPSDSAFYEIYLHDVELIPFHREELVDSKEIKTTALSGTLTEEELPASLRNHFEFNSDDKEIRILNYMEKGEFSLRGGCEYAAEAIENILLNLFEISQWKVIKLENIRILENQESKPLNFQFISDFFDNLWPYADKIKEFSLKKADLFNKSRLATFLKKASQLKVLSLEDAQLENKFQPYNVSNIFLNMLCEALVYHPSLKRLDLGDTALNEEDYEELFKLLNNNYRLDTIFLKYPPFGNLNQLHHQLTQEMKERVKHSSLVRFQENQLTYSNRYKIAELSLELDQFHPLKFKFDHTTKKLVITYPSDLALPTKLINDLPEGLSNYPEFLQNSFPIQLDLSQAIDNQTTLGAQLLEKAFQLRKPKSMELLLTAGADLLEQLPDKPSLIGTIFSDSNKGEKIYKELILNHVKKDLSVFVPFISRLSTRYGEIDAGLKKIKVHLDEFITTLLELDQLPFLLKLFKRIGVETKKENWEKDFRLVIQAAQAGTQKNPITHSSLSAFEAIIKVLYTEVESAKKQWFRGYQFNVKLLESLEQLLQSTREYQSALFNEWEQQEGGILIENTQLKEELKNSKETIEQMKAQHAQDKAKFESTRAQDRVDIQNEIRKEFESKQMQDRIDIQNKMRTEFELKRAQDKAEFETTRAQDRAEFEQSNAKMEERIEKIMNDLLRLQQQSTPLGHSIQSNTHLFKPR